MLFALIILASLAMATPVVQVTEPNGGEVIQIGRTWTTEFTISDNTNPQTLTANIFYSTSAGTKQNLIANIDLLHGGYCSPSFTQEDLWVRLTQFTDGNVPIGDYLTFAYWANGEVGTGKLMWFGGTSGGYIDHSGYVNMSNGQLVETGELNGKFDLTKPIYFTLYKPASNTPTLGFYSSSGGNPNSYYNWELRWNSIMGKFDWINDINHFTYFNAQLSVSGGCFIQNAQPTVAELVELGVNPTMTFMYDGHYWLLTRSYYSWSGGGACPTRWGLYRYIGAGIWTRDMSLIDTNTNFGTIVNVWEVGATNNTNKTINCKVIDDILYCYGVTGTDNSIQGIFYDEDQSRWLAVPDFNNGISQAMIDILKDFPTGFKFIDYLGDDYLFQQKTSTNQYVLWERGMAFNTETTRTCRYYWDVNATPNDYYLDVEVIGTDTALDSSSATFTVQEEFAPAEGENPAYEFTPISGVSDYSFGAAMNLEMVSTGDVIYKLKHIRAGYDPLNHYVFNSGVDGKQYWVYTINCEGEDNCDNYQDGLWTFNAGLTLSDNDGKPIQKIWDENHSAFGYKFTDSVFFKDNYTYYKLVYKDPMRSWDLIRNNGNWINLNAPQSATYIGQTWDGFLASYVNNVYSKLLLKIPTLASDCTPQPNCRAYDFQFTAFSDVEGTQLQVLSVDEDTGAESYITTIELTTTPIRYKAPVYDDYLVFKTTLASGAAYIRMRDYALLQRGYFRDALEILTTAYSELPARRNNIYSEYGSITGGYAAKVVYTDHNIGQTFTTDVFTDSINTITIWGHPVVSPATGYMTATLYRNAAKTETIATSTIDVAGIVGYHTPLTFVFDTSGIEDNNTYYIEFHKDGNTIDDGFNIDYNESGTIRLYPRDYKPLQGNMYYNGSIENGKDMRFGLQEGGVFQYINEGGAFRAVSSAYNNQNTLQGLANKLKIITYMDTYADENRVMVWEYEIPEETGFLDLDYLLNGVIDRLDQKNPFTVFVTMMLCNDDFCFEQISNDFSVIQYPSSIGDIDLAIRNYEVRLGHYPYGRLNLDTSNPDAIVGIELTLIKPAQLETKTISQIISDQTYHYRTVYYKGRDFNCASWGDCSFDFYIDDWVWAEAVNYVWVATAILTTKTTNYDDFLTNSIRVVKIEPLNYDKAQLVEAFARTQTNWLWSCSYCGYNIFSGCAWCEVPTPNYRNSELTRWAFKVRDMSGEDIRDDLLVEMQIRDCGISYDCNSTGAETDWEALRYKPTGTSFDNRSGENLYMFEDFLLEDNGSLLDDGHFYRMRVTVDDVSGLHQAHVEVYLTQSPQPSKEIKFLVNNAYQCVDSPEHTCNPQLQCFGCLHLPNEDNLKQDIFCMGVYSVSETQIDTFETTISNQYSNFQEDDPNLQQYIRWEIDWKDMMEQDPQLSRQLIEQSYDTPLEDLGSLILYNLKWLGADVVWNSVGEMIDLGTWTGWALNPTTGIRTDCNFMIPIDQVGGWVSYKIEGIELVNKANYPELDGVPASQFYKYCAENNISLPQEKTTVWIYSGTNLVQKKEVPSRMVIWEEPTISDPNADGNRSIGNLLRFDLVEKMYYANKTSSMQSTIPLMYNINLGVLAGDNPISDLFEGIGEVIFPQDTDNDGTISAEERNRGWAEGSAKIAGVILNNAVWFIVILGSIMIIAFLIRAIKGAKS